MDEEYLEALKRLRERIISLREEKADLLRVLDDLEADGEVEVDALEADIAGLQTELEQKSKAKKKAKAKGKVKNKPSENEIVFRF